MRAAFLSLFFVSMLNNNAVSQIRQIDLQGHRGCRGLMPENTIPAMYEAIRLGVTTIELDVVVSKDGKLVVSHEPFMSPEISIPPIESKDQFEKGTIFNIYQMDYDEIAKWDVGLKKIKRFPDQFKMAAQKPLLDNLIDSTEYFVIANNLKPIYYNIETKCNPSSDGVYHPAPKEFVEKLIQVLKEKNILERSIIQSFDKRTIQYLHTNYPFVKTSFLIGDKKYNSLKEILSDLGFTPDIISPEFNLINNDLINQCHQQDIKVIAWTVNDRIKIKSLYDMGIDGIISDYPTMFDVIKSQ
jgi:glycerophosphoryl diester phosphodiesterase